MTVCNVINSHGHFDLTDYIQLGELAIVHILPVYFSCKYENEGTYNNNAYPAYHEYCHCILHEIILTTYNNPHPFTLGQVFNN